jgi:hypothetical protein
MSFRRVAAIASVAALALCVTAEAKLPPTKHKLIVPGTSLGGIVMHMKLSAAKHVWKGGQCTGKPSQNGGCSFTDTKDSTKGTANFTWQKGRVVEVSINAGSTGSSLTYGGPLTKFHTANGVKIGSTSAQVKRAYPHAKDQGGGFQITGHHYNTFFAITNDKVFAISIALKTLRG